MTGQTGVMRETGMTSEARMMQELGMMTEGFTALGQSAATNQTEPNR